MVRGKTRAAGMHQKGRRRVCIVCGNERVGLPVRNDHVIHAIRWIKTNITKNEKNNVLVVCKECYPKYKKERSRFVSRMAIYVGLGIVFLIVGLVIASVGTLLFTLPVLALLYLLSLLNYMPDLDVQAIRGDKEAKR